MGSTTQVVAITLAAVALQQLTSRRRKQQQETAAKQAEKTKKQLAEANASSADNDKTFVIEIEYCTGCRWMLRAGWMAQELLTTFQTDPESKLRSIMLTPNAKQGGVFNVYLHSPDEDRELLWSRKVAGRFPESKELKQIVRDYICPDRSLGHSDKK